jgi:hypothetical protein
MTTLDRERLKRDCAVALEALHRDQRVDAVAGLADALRAPRAALPLPWRADVRGAAGRARERAHLALNPRAREAGEGDVEARGPRGAQNTRGGETTGGDE